MNAVSKAPTSMPPALPKIRHDQRSRHDHVVQFYGDDSAFLDSLVEFIGAALRAGDTALLIATEAHREEFARRLEAKGIDVSAAAAHGRYIPLDANATLSSFMIDGMPDPALFEEIIGGRVLRARKEAGDESLRVVAFGEMVALLLANGQPEAALALERLWTRLSKTLSFSLRCAYPMDQFSDHARKELFMKICDEHAAVIPAEGYAMLSSEEDRLRSIAELQQKAKALEAQLALHRSEEQLRLLVESVQDYAIFLLDPEGRVATWNLGAQRIKGYQASEIIGKHFSIFYPEEDLRAGKPQMELRVATEVGRFEDEGGWRLRKDGTRFWANVVITALRDSSGNLQGFSKITRDITERMLALEALRNSNKELREEVDRRTQAESKLQESERSLRKLSGHLLRMQDEERRRLGRELHDSVGQYLAALKMGLDSLGADSDHQIQECIRMTDLCMKEVRTISYLLYPPMLEEVGLRSAIPWYIEGFSKRSGIQVACNIDRNVGRLSRDAELAIFRILQESLTNVHRHSESPTAQVSLGLEDGTVCLQVSDQGKGISPSVLKPGSDSSNALGVGLRGMVERMNQLGGSLELSSDERGTTVRVRVPLEK
ncbi:MAG TPA: PAS domain S-box protein [Candidatus Acidoferrales bacterium]